MDDYYSNQSALPHFSGNYRQRGSGFGALAAGIGRFAIPLVRKVLFPAAKRIGKELLVQGAPEVVEVITKRKSPRKAVQATVRKTVKKQLGAGRPTVARRRRRRTSKRKISTSRKRTQRSRSNFFSKVRK